MNNLKIKSYSLKKNPDGLYNNFNYLIDRKREPSMNKLKLSEKNQENKNDKKGQEKSDKIEKENLNEKTGVIHTNQFQSTLLNEVNKIIKTPGLNISSKLDSKGKL
jgi:hypothetical protein